MTRRFVGSSLACLVLALVTLGCAMLNDTLDPLGRRSDLEDAQRRYTQFVRWGELGAATAFVAADSREEFLALAPQLESMRFTDYEQGELDYAKGSESATIEVIYRGYRMSSLVDRPMRETQRWVRDTEGGGWQVHPDWREARASLGMVQP